LWLGPWRDSEEKPFGFKWPKEPVRALGIFLSYDAPKSCIPTINTSIFQFIWKKKKYKIKRELMYQNYDRGGLRVPNVDEMIKFLRLAWIPRLLSNDEKWSEVSNNLVPRVLSLPRESTLVAAGHVSMYTKQIRIGGGSFT